MESLYAANGGATLTQAIGRRAALRPSDLSNRPGVKQTEHLSSPHHARTASTAPGDAGSRPVSFFSCFVGPSGCENLSRPQIGRLFGVRLFGVGPCISIL